MEVISYNVVCEGTYIILKIHILELSPWKDDPTRDITLSACTMTTK